MPGPDLSLTLLSASMQCSAPFFTMQSVVCYAPTAAQNGWQARGFPAAVEVF
ncbi:MAG: hypothetical protein J0H86_13175 [Xanthomonadaceae bacterium]|nr:hypothetical protein [Xanthomonadaceae bacterium]